MSNEPPRDGGPAEIDWRSPRWREADERQGDTEREHRFRDDAPKPERGAVDRVDSVGRRQEREERIDGGKV